MKAILRIAIVSLVFGLALPAAKAQVKQWNQIVTDKALERAFYRALREASVAYINEMEASETPAVIAFVDSQLDYPLQLTTGDFQHVQLNAAQSKINYLIQYQAKSTAGTVISIGGKDVGKVPVGLTQAIGFAGGDYGGVAEIPGDGGMMLCPVNKNGLEFMYGGLAIASLDANGQFRDDEDRAAIQQLHDEILELTYSYYGNTPE